MRFRGVPRADQLPGKQIAGVWVAFIALNNGIVYLFLVSRLGGGLSIGLAALLIPEQQGLGGQSVNRKTCSEEDDRESPGFAKRLRRGTRELTRIGRPHEEKTPTAAVAAVRHGTEKFLAPPGQARWEPHITEALRLRNGQNPPTHSRCAEQWRGRQEHGLFPTETITPENHASKTAKNQFFIRICLQQCGLGLTLEA